MQLGRRRFLKLAGGAATLTVASRMARAQSYPSRPITAVVAFAASGSGDTIARILAEHMRKTLGQTIVIKNVGGAAGTIGVGRVARATPDGYTISFGNWPTHVLNGAIYPLQYHVLDDFEPIPMLASGSWSWARAQRRGGARARRS
jgi:tripartite-type tricarboxylate transporter receptor subunit TctC